MEDDLWKMAGVRELVSHQEKDYKMAPTRLPSVDTLRRERWLSSIASQRFSPGRLSGSRGFAILVLCQDLGELPPRLAPDQLSASAAFPLLTQHFPLRFLYCLICLALIALGSFSSPPLFSAPINKTLSSL